MSFFATCATGLGPCCAQPYAQASSESHMEEKIQSQSQPVSPLSQSVNPSAAACGVMDPRKPLWLWQEMVASKPSLPENRTTFPWSSVRSKGKGKLQDFSNSVCYLHPTGNTTGTVLHQPGCPLPDEKLWSHQAQYTPMVLIYDSALVEHSGVGGNSLCDYLVVMSWWHKGDLWCSPQGETAEACLLWSLIPIKVREAPSYYHGHMPALW